MFRFCTMRKWNVSFQLFLHIFSNFWYLVPHFFQIDREIHVFSSHWLSINWFSHFNVRKYKCDWIVTRSLTNCGIIPAPKILYKKRWKLSITCIFKHFFDSLTNISITIHNFRVKLNFSLKLFCRKPPVIIQSVKNLIPSENNVSKLENSG